MSVLLALISFLFLVDILDNLNIRLIDNILTDLCTRVMQRSSGTKVRFYVTSKPLPVARHMEFLN